MAELLGEVLRDYENFVTGFLDIKDEQIRTKVETEIADGLLWPEPWLALNPAFEPGGTVAESAEVRRKPMTDRRILRVGA